MTVISSTSRVVALAASAVLAASLLSGCSILQSVLAGGGDDVFSIAVGDCWDDQDGTASEVSTVASVECEKPHDNEAFASVLLDDGDYPGDAAVLDFADQGCYDKFTGFVGIAYDDSELYFSYFYPTTDSWENGDREVLCFVYQDAKKTTGTLADSKL